MLKGRSAEKLSESSLAITASVEGATSLEAKDWKKLDAAGVVDAWPALAVAADKIKNSIYTCCDGACGTGGMLTVAQERLTALAKANGKKVSIHLVGREILDPRFNAAIGACPHAPKWTNQALKERLRQCPHPDVKNTVRPSRRLEHIRLSP